MRIRFLIAIATTGLCSGCFYIGQERLEDVVQKPPSAWSSRDCLTVVLTAMVHNLHDEKKNIEVIATPFYPSVIVALNQLRKTEQHWSEEDARYHMDEMMEGTTGLYVDWKDGRFVNARGNYFRDQTDIDSLLVMITLKNKTWPCAVPSQSVKTTMGLKDVPLLPMQDWPCYIPDITTIGKNIFLVSEDGDTLRPKYVEGRRHETLTSRETLFAMFQLRWGSGHFLKDRDVCRLEIAGFDTPMTFPLVSAKMR